MGGGYELCLDKYKQGAGGMRKHLEDHTVLSRSVLWLACEMDD